jgi:catechol 2,3-dioxygenase-like lactoylglutathione lyase family enzyme
MRIHVMSIFVDDQEAALSFYTNVMGFRKKADVPLGEHRWLTVSETGADGEVELLLEPGAHPAVGPFRAALVSDGIPLASFAVDDLACACDLLCIQGVRFAQEVTEAGGVKTAIIDDTCGNLVQLVELPHETR